MDHNILVITLNSWDDDKSIGNTLSNIFKEFNDFSFKNLYFKENIPNNTICDSYFRLAFSDSIKKSGGVSFTKNTLHLCIVNNQISSFYTLLSLIFRDIVIILQNKMNKKILNFFEQENCNLIFVPVSISITQQWFTNYIHNHTNAKLVLFHMDDTYSLKQFSLNPAFWIYRFISRYYTKKNVLNADINYVISDLQKREYTKYFYKEFKILYKNNSFTQSPEKAHKKQYPLKIVYTGNILPKRWKTLSLLGKIIHRINNDTTKIQLLIYTRNKLSKRIKHALSFSGSVFIMGAVTQNEVFAVQSKSDILLHVEPFSLKERLDVRLSFSTKLVDYFHQAKCIFAVGPEEVASMDYLIKNDAAITAVNEKEIEEKLKMIIDNPEIIKEYGDKAWECGKKNHQIDKIQAMLKEDFENLIKN